MTGQLIQIGGSLIAIFILAWLVHRFGMGRSEPLDSEDKARCAASEVEDGFHPVAIALDNEGQAALLRDHDGRIMLLRAHGAHFAGRLLQPGSDARIEDGTLLVDPREKRFGSVRLRIEEADAWGKAIRAL